MNKYIHPDATQWKEILARPLKEKHNLDQVVREVFDAVKKDGDKAIAAFTKQFDGAELKQLIATEEEINNASVLVSEELKSAINVAYNNILAFHENQKSAEPKIETTSGVQCWRKSTAIEKVGLYIPGGTAPLFSTVLMLAIPAKIAGCKEIVLCSPPNKEGKLHPAILYCAKLAGVHKVVKAGGIQAVAGLTFGTESIPAVSKIFGPGNQYVTAAKEQSILEGVSIDMPAGPSEVLVFADETADPAFIAADLLSQCEHGMDSQAILVCTSEEVLLATEKEVSRQLAELPKKEIASASIENSRLVLTYDLKESLALINAYAPEHFIVMCKDEEYIMNNIVNAGSVFLGAYTPESAGDYASGTNHTLPTNGFAKAYSGVSLDSFTKKITFQKISKEGLNNIGPAIMTMAENEELIAHKRAVSVRLNQGN